MAVSLSSRPHATNFSPGAAPRARSTVPASLSTASGMTEPPGAWPPQRSEMADLIRSHDWAATPLGALPGWPAELRHAVVAMLDSPNPMNVLWGDDLIQLYNDAFRPTLERRHPAALGQKTAECWPEVWGFNEPIYRRVLASGDCVSLEDQPFVIAPAGIAATRYFTTGYTPVRRADGSVAGVLVTSTETTGRVLAERLLREAIEDARRAERALAEADRLKDVFLATLAHELRNPLAPIRTAAQALSLQGLPSSEIQRASGVINRQVRHMARLLETCWTCRASPAASSNCDATGSRCNRSSARRSRWRGRRSTRASIRCRCCCPNRTCAWTSIRCACRRC